MIEFNDNQYGCTIILEPTDFSDIPPGWLPQQMEDLRVWHIPKQFLSSVQKANVVAFRNVSTGKIKILKNRYLVEKDNDIRKLVLDYREEIFELIETRFDILDI